MTKPINTSGNDRSTRRATRYLRLTVALSVLLSAAFNAVAQGSWNRVAHSQGNLQLTIEPGQWGGTPWSQTGYLPVYDPITGDSIYGCEYPRGSQRMYWSGDLVLGAVSGRDTLATWIWGSGIGDRASLWKIRSSHPSSPYYSRHASSDLDLECLLHDTVTRPIIYWTRWEWAPHLPLEVIGRQRSMAWSGSLVDDFILIDYEITNVGVEVLRDAYVGLWCASYEPFPNTGNGDNLTGFLSQYRFSDLCEHVDVINLAYSMDADGDPEGGRFSLQSRRGSVGVMLLGSSSDDLDIGYTWVVWDAAEAEDWGPRRRQTEHEPYRSFNPYFAWPGSDRNLYYILSHPHIAYDQMFSAVDHFGWLPAWKYAEQVASGWPFQVFYSFGPFEIPAKDKISFTIAVVGGDNVHNDPFAYFDPNNPQPYYDQLDFSELAGIPKGPFFPKAYF